MDTANIRINFGRHKGHLWTRLPLGYLKWLANQADMQAEALALANAEIKRRGHKESELVSISTHAIDRASIRILPLYLNHRREEEGIVNWLIRRCESIYKDKGELKGKIRDGMGVTWVFQNDTIIPELVTVFFKDDNGED